MSFWPDEWAFQRSIVEAMRRTRWHVQPMLEDPGYPGIPDLSAAHSAVGECWLELKCIHKPRWVYDPLRVAIKGSRRLTAQQYQWLCERMKHGPARCGVLVAFRLGHVEDDRVHRVGGKVLSPIAPLEYVIYIPIQAWKAAQRLTLASLILNSHAASVEDLMADRATIGDLIRGTLRPGWYGSSERSAARLRTP
jgi:hypothetical protein